MGLARPSVRPSVCLSCTDSELEKYTEQKTEIGENAPRDRRNRQGRNDGGYIGIYTPKSVYLKFFMWLFCLLDPFIPTQIKFLATPLVIGAPIFRSKGQSQVKVKLARLWADGRGICRHWRDILFKFVVVFTDRAVALGRCPR